MRDKVEKLYTDIIHPGQTALKRQLASTDPTGNYNKIITEITQTCHICQMCKTKEEKTQAIS
jgi:hypothetical protein